MEEQAAADIENLKAGKPLGDKRHHIHNKLPGFYLNVTLPQELVYIHSLNILYDKLFYVKPFDSLS